VLLSRLNASDSMDEDFALASRIAATIREAEGLVEFHQETEHAERTGKEKSSSVLNETNWWRFWTQKHAGLKSFCRNVSRLSICNEGTTGLSSQTVTAYVMDATRHVRASFPSSPASTRNSCRADYESHLKQQDVSFMKRANNVLSSAIEELDEQQAAKVLSCERSQRKKRSVAGSQTSSNWIMLQRCVSSLLLEVNEDDVCTRLEAQSTDTDSIRRLGNVVKAVRNGLSLQERNQVVGEAYRKMKKSTRFWELVSQNS